jgi:signal transduction histidine kinase
VAIWAMTWDSYFWPIWPFIGLGVLVGLHRAALRPGQRSLELRVDELKRTRTGVLDVQASELRRIERDLHDGAQARLVALTMQLGRAEERLADRPETAALVRRAREEATAAIAELRDLARGIAPPVLADRGLEAAVRSLAARSTATVEVTADLPVRLPPVVETAAYFVVAESLTNIVKHAPGASARVTLQQDGGMLVVEVIDDGPGGADPSGGGLTGLRQRVEALDGRLEVHSVAREGTVIWAVLPCE